MKKIFLSFCIVLLGITLFAQPKIQFESTTYDFGSIKEEGGKVTGRFNFTNVGDSALTLVRVKPGCGCTAANYSKGSIEPGQKGFIEATYNPYGRPGGFNKVIRVTTNEPQFADPSAAPHNIFIKGNVIKRPPTVFEEAGYTQGQGMIRIKENIVKINLLNSKKEKIRVIVRNFSNKPSKIEAINLPAHITLDSTSFKNNMMKANEEGKLVFLYDASKKNDMGEFKETIFIMTDDSIQPKKTVLVTANIKEDFSKYSAAQMKVAPMIEVASKEVNFGQVSQGSTPHQEIVVTNKGTNDLFIRQLISSNNVYSVKIDKNRIAKGEQGIITITFNARGRRGMHKATIDLISNDPRNSEIVINISGEQLQ